jgi:NAD(P)H dehydrogenase (quinone)
MHKHIDVYGFKFPGIPDVQHVYFYAVWGADDKRRKEYLEKAYQLGKEF